MNKEFGQLKFQTGEPVFTDDLRLGVQQLFVTRWMDPNHQKQILFMKHDTGSGKTIGSLSAAASYIEMYRKLIGGSIIIVGFQKNTFINEMLSKPDLGFITHFQYDRLMQLKTKADRGIELFQQEYKNYRVWLKKQIASSRFGGVVKFFGYKELGNILYNDKGQINQTLLDLFENSFVICDEIHNVYNSLEQNNYGETLQTIFDYFHNTNKPIKILLMSATPINNKPSEIVDLLNLLVPTRLRGGKLLEKVDFFHDETLKAGALDRIRALISGYFSFYINNDPALTPTYRITGDPMHYGRKKISYLRFVKCKPGAEQVKILRKFARIPIDGHGMLDIVFPDGIYTNQDIEAIAVKSSAWKSQHELDYADTAFGNILALQNLPRWSGKYYKMVQDVIAHTKIDAGKLMLSHEYVHGTGVKLIAEILRTNGFIGVGSVPAANTRCVVCSIAKSTHAASGHEFIPARFAVIHGEIPNKNIKTAITKYNAPANDRGHNIKILIASKMIREGYNFTSVRGLWVMHSPPNISALIQLMGRPIRRYSHVTLPVEDRNVEIRIYVTTGGTADYMNRKYYTKIEEYKVIQRIERVIHESAVDSDMYIEEISKSFNNTGLGPLKYAVKRRPRKYRVNDYMYNIFYGDWEIHEISRLIMSLFSRTPVWSYANLWKQVRNSPFLMNVDPASFSEENFIIALYKLVYGDDYDVNPTLIVINGVKYRISYASGLYILFPARDISKPSAFGENVAHLRGLPDMDYNTWLSYNMIENFGKIDITNKLKTLNISYTEMKRKFYEKFRDVDFQRIPLETEIYSIDFHIKFIEEAIGYVFNLLTGKIGRSEYHYFYFKMLHFYKQIELIIYASELPTEYFAMYKDYISDRDPGNNFLMTTISNSSSIPSFEIKGIESFLTRKINKVPARLLPVGHFLRKEVDAHVVPRLYKPSGWYEEPEFSKDYPIRRENDIIVGFYQKNDSGINPKFKLRNPRHKIKQHSDYRLIEKGVVCATKKKSEIIKIAKQLGVDTVGSNNDVCNRIKINLMSRELKERNKYRKGLLKEPVRWFYLIFEAQ